MAIPLESLYDLTEPTGVTVSPDGDRVAVTADEFDPATDERRGSLFVVPSDGSAEPHRLARASDASAPVWSPDGDRLAFLAARETDVGAAVGRDSTDEDAESEETDGDENGDTDDTDDPRPQVWVFDLRRGGDARRLTAFEEGVRSFDWGPEGDRLVVAARDPTEAQREEITRREEDGPIQIDRLQHKADGVGWLDEVRTYLFVCDANEVSDTDTARRLDDAYGSGAREPLFGLQPAWGSGGRIAFASTRTENPDDTGAVDLHTIAADGTDRRQLTDGIRTSAYSWGPDGDRVAFAAGDPKNWYRPTELRVTPDAPDAEAHSVTASLDRTLARQADPAWLDDDTLLVAVADEGHTRLVTCAADADDPARTFPAQTRDRNLVGVDADGGRVATILSEQSTGIDTYTVATEELAADEPASLTQVTAFDRPFDETDLPTCRRVTYTNDDGEAVEAIVHLPPEFDPETDEPRPVIASIHGGPMSYDAPEFGFTYTYWAARGYVVYRPNYRGSTSYGRAFAESLRGTRGDLETDDVCSGLDALADRGWVDPDRSLVTGFSYGGITTANVVTRTDAFTVAAAEHGVYDFRSTFGTDDNHLWHEWEFGMPWDEPDTYETISSITDVDRVETPILLTAGEHDWRCPPTQAEQFYVSVKKRGVPARLVVYQNEHHNVDDPDRAIHRVRSITDWFEEHADLAADD